MKKNIGIGTDSDFPEREVSQSDTICGQAETE